MRCQARPRGPAPGPADWAPFLRDHTRDLDRLAAYLAARYGAWPLISRVQLARQFGVSGERLRQIEGRALRALCRQPAARALCARLPALYYAVYGTWPAPGEHER